MITGCAACLPVGVCELIADAREVSRSNRILYYHVTVTNGEGAVVALFRGTAYRTEKPHAISS